jgi:hypothetical protein
MRTCRNCGHRDFNRVFVGKLCIACDEIARQRREEQQLVVEAQPRGPIKVSGSAALLTKRM